MSEVRRSRKLPVDVLGVKLPNAFTAAELDQMLPLLRSGDSQIIEHTILGCLRLAAAISNRHARTNAKRAHDLFGVASLALVEAIDRIVQGKALTEHNNIGGYLHQFISGRVQDFKITDNVVRIPRGEGMVALIREQGFEAIQSRFATIPYEERDPDDRDDTDSAQYLMDMEYAQKEDTGYDLSFDDFAGFAKISARDIAILKSRIDGETYEELASQFGLSLQRIAQILTVLKKQLTKYRNQRKNES